MADIGAPGPRVPDGTASPAATEAGGGRGRLADAGRLAAAAAEAVLVASGLVFLVIGAVDLGTADALVSKLFGVVLGVVGCGLLVAGAGFRRGAPWAGVTGAMSLLAAVGLATYLSLNARNEEPVWGLVFAGLAGACVAALVAVVRTSPPSFTVKSASILSVAGFVLGFFQFSYAQSASVRVGSTLTLSTDLAPAPSGDGTVAATVRTVNPTGAKIQSLGSLYVVEGVRLCRRAGAGREHASFRETFADETEAASFSPRVAERDVEVIQAGKVFEDRTYFEPGEEIVRRFAVAIPEAEYDVVRLRVVMAVANGDRLQLDEVVRGPSALHVRRDGMKGMAVVYRVTEGSLVDRILHADRVVEVVWESGRGALDPKLWATARLASAEDEDGDRSSSYGMAFTRSTTELPVGDGEIDGAGGSARPERHERAPMFATGLPPRSDAPAGALQERPKHKPHKWKPHKWRGEGNPHKWKPSGDEPSVAADVGQAAEDDPGRPTTSAPPPKPTNNRIGTASVPDPPDNPGVVGATPPVAKAHVFSRPPLGGGKGGSAGRAHFGARAPASARATCG